MHTAPGAREGRFLRACRRESVDRTPVWFMRQAGRCLADYRALRKRYDILTLAKTPDLCAQVTLMPIEAFGVDAAVMFADIMLPLEPMGVELEIQPDIGPIIHNPIRSAADVDRLVESEPDLAATPPDDGAAEIEYLLARFGAATDVADWSDAEHIAAVLARKFGSHVGSLSARGRLAAYRGRQREAERLSDSLGSLTRMKYPYLRGMNTHARAQIAAILGERETAVQLLRDAFAEGLQYDTYRPSRLRSFNHALPEFQSLRGYEPFDQLVRPQH